MRRDEINRGVADPMGKESALPFGAVDVGCRNATREVSGKWYSHPGLTLEMHHPLVCKELRLPGVLCLVPGPLCIVNNASCSSVYLSSTLPKVSIW